MSSKIQVISQKFNNQLYNGHDFSINPDTDFAPNAVGINGEKLRVRQTVTVFTSLLASNQNKFYFTNEDGAGYCSIELTGKNWFNEGFSVGDSVRLIINTFQNTRTITSLSETLAIFSDDLGPSFVSGEYDDIEVYNVEPLAALEYRFGLVGNDETPAFISKLTDEDQRYYTDGIGLAGSTAFVDMKSAGAVKSWASGSAKVRFVEFIDVKNSSGATISNAGQKFELSHEFRLLPFYRDGDFETLRAGENTDIFEGDATLKYINNYSFSAALSNPSGAKSQTLDFTLGSVGGFGETFNGFDSNYRVTSISYEDADILAPVETLKSTGKTTITVTAEKLVGNFSVGERIGFYLSYLPEADVYTNKTTDFDNNFLYNPRFCNIDGGGLIGGSTPIVNLRADTVDSNTVTIIALVEFNSDQQVRLYNATDPKYLVGIQMGDQAKKLDVSDQVIELADVNYFSNELLLEGLANSEQIRIFEHGHDYLTEEGSSDFNGWVEDGVLAAFRFNVDLSKDAKILSVKQKVIAVDVSDPFSAFDLDSTPIGIGENIVVDGVQEIEVNSSKAYNLASSDPFQKLEIHTLGRAGDLQSYQILAGQKIPWQNWQKIIADYIFYDKTKPKNGLNRKASNYSDVNNFSIKLAYSVLLSGVDDLGRSGITEYVFSSPDIKVNDYLIPADWTAEIQTLDPDTLASLDKNIYTDKPTFFRIIWEKTGVAITDISEFYSISRIEPVGQGGFTKYELSTVAPVPAGTPLLPLPGESGLKMYLSEDKVFCDCLIDFSSTNGVNLSGRVSTGGGGIPANAKTTEDGLVKTTEGGLIKTLE